MARKKIKEISRKTFHNYSINQKIDGETSNITLNSNNVGEIDYKSEISDYDSPDNITNEFHQVQDQGF